MASNPDMLVNYVSLDHWENMEKPTSSMKHVEIANSLLTYIGFDPPMLNVVFYFPRFSTLVLNGSTPISGLPVPSGSIRFHPVPRFPRSIGMVFCLAFCRYCLLDIFWKGPGRKSWRAFKNHQGTEETQLQNRSLMGHLCTRYMSILLIL